MSLTDQDTGVVDGLGKSKLEDLGLQTPFQEILNLETKDVIKLHAALIQHTDADQTTQKGVT